MSTARAALSLIVAVLAAGCMPKAPETVPTQVPKIAWEQKLAWIARLEDQRLLRDPNPVAPAIIRPATKTLPALVAPPPPTDLLVLLGDAEARVRRRAALAIGRVGLPDGVEPLTKALGDEEPEVRQMAAFALGLIGSPAARPALTQALSGNDVVLQGRAAEALGLIGDKADGPAIGQMVRTHIAAGALASVQPEDLTSPLAPPVEAARLGLFALARLGTYEPLSAAVIGADGQPVSRWWPVAYALQRVGDARGAPALLALLSTPGRYTASFAVRGLAAAKATQPQALAAIRAEIEQPRDAAVMIQAIRALGTLNDRGALPLMTRIVGDPASNPAIRLEAMNTLATLADARTADILVELVSDSAPAVRGAAMRALARVEPETFTATLSGLDADREWTVRVAQAGALGGLPDGQGFARLSTMADDADVRVVPAVLAALAASKAPGAPALIRAKLKAPDVVVRSAAAQALAQLKVADAAGDLRAAYAAAAADAAYTARASMLAALAQLDPAGTRPLLDEALRDKDWAMRVRAADLLRDLKVTDGVAAAMRPATPGGDVESAAWKTMVAPPFSPHVFIDTDKGTVEIELAVLDAPITSRNFVNLARKGFFNGVAFHRIVPDFVVQGGDPRGDGEGGPGYTIRDELNQRPYLRGTVGMALDWRDTGGSQFFIALSPAPHLDARYTVFGTVVAGMDVADRLLPWDVIRRVRIRDGVTPE
ncbi:MAG TPA: HEAT repeat domain-containing protein [Vicinamibacterales bacterium]|jgi:cyclophilin family peptidyl-prolyl cis-trans isomerase/HEAT repeat protein|nr:HEAT repeat domain-containing protein [Vicinamibacterales bacterium]